MELGGKMLRSFAVVSVALALIGLTPAATAVAQDGFYVTLIGIGGFSEVNDLDNDGSAGSIGNDDESDIVGGLGAAFGYQWDALGGKVRTEAEFHYRFRFDLDDQRPVVSGFPNAGLDSNLATATWLANANYLLDLGYDIYPYVGGGLGATYYDAENEFNDIGGLGRSDDDTDGVNFTWAVNAGALWDITESLHLILGYRYIDLGEIDFGSFGGGGVDVEGDYVSHDLILSLGYRF